MFVSSNAAANNLPAYTQALTQSCNSTQHFRQSLFFKNQDQPFRVDGQILYRCHRYLRWTTQSPYPSETYFDGKQYWQTFDLKQKSFRFEMNPSASYINEILWALMYRDFSFIYGNFHVNASLNNHRWSIRLKPKTARLMSLVHSVHLQGQDIVERLSIEYTSGDRALIEFSNLSDR